MQHGSADLVGEGDDVMPSIRDATALGELRGRVAVLEVACGSCDRVGRYRVETLIDRYGATCRLADVGEDLARSCPGQDATECERCEVYFRGIARSYTATIFAFQSIHDTPMI